jgi:predicted component of type VI protein secretion system
MIRFVVEAILRMDPDPVRVVFDTMLDPSSGAIRVEGEHA